MSEATRNFGYFALVALMIASTGVIYSWNSAIQKTISRTIVKRMA